MTWDVLIVDDDVVFAADLADFLRELLALRVSWVQDAATAERTVASEGVKVLVLDQRMPDEDGVTLGTRLKAIDPRIRRILLSGEATAAEITGAYDVRFDRSIHKNAAINELPGAVRHSIFEWHRSIINASRDATLLLQVARGWGPLRRVERQLFLLSVDSVDASFVVEGSWLNSRQIYAGEEVTETFEIEWTRSNALTVSQTQTLSTDLGLHVPQLAELAAKIQTQLSTTHNSTLQISTRRKLTSTKRIALPPEPADPTGLHVRSRVHQVAPVYTKVGVTLIDRCLCCGVERFERAELLLEANRIATRHVDFLSNNTTQAVDTGILDQN